MDTVGPNVVQNPTINPSFHFLDPSQIEKPSDFLICVYQERANHEFNDLTWKTLRELQTNEKLYGELRENVIGFLKYNQNFLYIDI